MEKHPIQYAAQEMRRHWYQCEFDWPSPYYWHCGPGYSHPKCEEGQRLIKIYNGLINQALQEIHEL